MTCRQLGGACDMKFQAESFEEMAELSKQHGIEMFQQQDEDHMNVVSEMMVLMQDPVALQKWLQERKEQYNNLPQD